MTFPGDSTTGSTALNDLRSGVEWVVFHAAITFYVLAIVVPLAWVVVAFFREHRKK